MPLPQATGSMYCCCPDCLMFADDFDCCFGSIPQCYSGYGDGKIACCIDITDPNLGTIPVRDLGDAWDWKNASGEWWKAWSPWPRYSIKDGAPCNDGALWEVTGHGSLTTKIGFPNTGFRIEFNIVTPAAGTKMRVLCWVHPHDPRVGYEVIIEYLGGGVFRATACGKSKDFRQEQLRPHTKVSILYVNKKHVFIRVGGTGQPFDSLYCCDQAIIGGTKFTFENISGSNIPLAIDDLVIYKDLVYPEQPETSPICWGFAPCSCQKQGQPPREAWQLPRTLVLALHAKCYLTGQEYYYEYELQQQAPRCDPEELFRSTWSHNTPICFPDELPGGPTQHWFQVLCGSPNHFELWYTRIQGESKGTDKRGLQIESCYPLRFTRMPSVILTQWIIFHMGCRGSVEQGPWAGDGWLEIYER